MAGINISHQNTVTYGQNCVHLHISNVATLKIVVSFHAFSLQGLLSGKGPWSFHEITKYLAIFYWRAQRHIFLELTFLPHLVRILASCKTDQLHFRRISGLCNRIKCREEQTHFLTKYRPVAPPSRVGRLESDENSDRPMDWTRSNGLTKTLPFPTP